jgi:hypothetical protein
MMRPEADDRDRAILAERMAARAVVDHPLVGDFVSFACGTVRRISHDWGDSVQTSDEHQGSWYLGMGYCSFSGSLHGSTDLATITGTNRKQDGRCWFFHHNNVEAYNGVDMVAPFRVWECSESAPR